MKQGPDPAKGWPDNGEGQKILSLGSKSIRTFAALAMAAALTACGSGTQVNGLMSPSHLDAADYRATGIPFAFGDTKPIEWEGLTPELYPVHGIDAARYQGRINWNRARASGVNFAWLKVTEGRNLLDPGFAINAPAARAAGVPVGGYHFYYFCRTAEEQADWFIKNVPRVAGDLPPMLDMEWNHGSSCKVRPSAAEVRSYILTFAQKVSRHYGTRPVIYTTPDFYEHNDLGALTGYEFFLRSVASHPSERYPDERWTFWQYSGTGVVPGIGGIVDMNAFAGDAATWVAWLSTRRQR
ncbi:GH25 family lysozyme [Pseudooceanicola sp. HF7]|uniref:GH25 family lysozyme n=1 Tax=Pseudooceanicola sp. HF7 TaxID=2721560 RepID=UPI0034C6AAC8